MRRLVAFSAALALASACNPNAGANIEPRLVASIAVTPPSPSAAKGEKVQLSAVATYTDGTTGDVTATAAWTSSDTGIATVATGGLVTTVAQGTATITASLGGKSAGSTVTVGPAIVSITVSPASPSIPKGSTQQLTATATYSDATTGVVTNQVTWTSSATSVAIVSPGGLVTGVTQGPATITATSGAVTGTSSVTVAPPAVVSIALSPLTPTMAKGTSVPMTATATYTDGTTGDVTATANWTSDATGVATVTNTGTKGTVTAMGVGTATITAAIGLVSAQTTVTVTNATVSSIALTPASPSIAKGRPQQMTATATFSDSSIGDVSASATWTSSNTAVATISAGGLVTTLTTGTTTITASYGGRSSSTTLTVTAAVISSIAVTPTNPSIAKGLTQQMAATATWTDGATTTVTTTATWTSSVTTVATVASGGLVTSVAQGTTTISAAVGSVTGSTSLTVTAPTIVSIAVSPTSPSIAKGLTQQMAATATMTDGTTQTVTSTATWTSSATTVATVASGGLVTSVAPGTTTIGATVGSVTGSTTLTVTAPTVVSIAVSPSAPSIAKGLTQQLSATATMTDSTTQTVTTTATWSSSNTAVATVTGGLVSSVAQGTATITAAYGGKSGTSSVTVTAPALVSVTVNPTSWSPPLGLHRQLTASAAYTDSTTQNVTATATWSSSVATVATVSNGTADRGVVRTVATGSTVVSAAFGGMTGTCTVTVGPVALVSIDLGPDQTVASTIQYAPWLPATGVYSDGHTVDLAAVATWSSSSTAVATVSNQAGARGKIAIVGTGSTQISATFGGVTGTMTLSVHTPLVVWVTALPFGSALPVGQSYQLTAKSILDDGTFQDVTATATWTSSDTSKATVVASGAGAGTVTGVAAGNMLVTASLGGFSGSAAVDVTAATFSGLAIWPANPTIGVPWGDAQLTAVASYSDGSAFDVSRGATWTSSNTSVAIVDWEGRVRGTAVGSATITAAYRGSSATTTLTATSMGMGGLGVSWVERIPMNQPVQFRAWAYQADGTILDVTDQATWSSGDPSVIVSSTAKGQVLGIQTGPAMINVSWQGQGNSTWTQVVSDTVQVVNVSPPSLTAPVGGTSGLSAVALFMPSGMPVDVTQVTVWSSNAPSVAAVSSAPPGQITALAGGSATVSALFGGRSGSCALTVKASPVMSISVTPGSASRPAGQTQSFTATATLGDASTLDVTRFARWASSDYSTAMVDGFGNAYAMRPGTAIVSASFDTAVGFATYDVLAPIVARVDVSPASPTVYVGTGARLRAYVVYSDYTAADATDRATWTSASTAIATVSDAAGTKGMVTGKAAGNTTVTASVDGVQGSTTVYVQSNTLQSVAVSPATLSLKMGSVGGLRLVGTLNCAGCTVDLTDVATWGSSAPTVATVSDLPGSKGNVSALGSGTATITATYGSWASSAAVTASAPALVGISAVPVYGTGPSSQACSADSGGPGSTSITMPIGCDLALVACAKYDNGSSYEVTQWASFTATTSNLTVSPTGTPRRLSSSAAGAGNFNVTFGGMTQSFPVTVTSATLAFVAPGSQGDPNAPIIMLPGVDSSLSLSARYSDGSSYDVTRFATIASSNTAVAAVAWDAVGSTERITAGTQGSAVLSADYRTTSTEVAVNVVSSGIVDSRVWLTASPPIPVGQQVGAIMQVTDGLHFTWDVTEKATWTSTNPAAASVSSTAGSRGTVTAAAPGFTTISGTFGTTTASEDVEVGSATLTALALDRAYQVAPVNASVPFRVWATYSDGSQWDATTLATWTVTPSSVAVAASAKGTFTVVGAGQATVQASFGGRSATARLQGF